MHTLKTKQTLRKKKEIERSIATERDNKGKIALHFACVNPGFPTSPDVVQFLVDLNPKSVNAKDDEDNLPLRRLAIKAKDFKEDSASHAGIFRILATYLNAGPDSTADFLTAIQALPDYLRDRAVITPTVQDTLNKKIAMRFPTGISLADFVFYILIIVCFSISVECTIDNRTQVINDEWNGELKCGKGSVVPYIIILLLASFYFFIRELLQVLSFLSMGLLKTWLFDATNLVDVLTIGLALYFGIDMCSIGDKDNILEMKDNLATFRWLASCALLIFWAAILSFLKSTFIDFAVFVGGLNNVLNRLVAFLMALIIILVAFAEIFVLIYFDSDKCKYCENGDNNNETICGDEYEEFDQFCRFDKSFIKVYTMLLGQVSDENFLVGTEGKIGIVGSNYREHLGVVYFALFMFLVVILLANVLIAIVTDSYGVIKNERAAIVFWSNRLDFVAEMDALFHGPFYSMIRSLVFLPELKAGEVASQKERFGESFWRTLVDENSNQADDLRCLSIDFFAYAFFRVSTMLFIVLIWLPAGLLSFGTLWPPQVREYIFIQRVSKINHGEVKELELRSIEVQALREEIKDLQDEIVHEMTADRKEVVAMKTQFQEMKHDLQNEMKAIKQIVMMLFDLQGAADQ